jgi:hypothetical protein
MAPKWIRYNREKCPVCQGASKECRGFKRDDGRLQVHCRGKVSAPIGWGYVGDDAHGFAKFVEGKDDRTERDWAAIEANRADRLAKEAEARRKLTTADQRDRVFRALLPNQRLAQRHRAELHRRGLNDQQIDLAESQGWLKTWVKGTAAHRAPDNIPGLVRSWHGAIETGINEGLAIAAPDLEGRLVLHQVRPDRLPADGGKYRYLASGNGELDGEMPLPVFQHPDRPLDRRPRLWITEAYLKPLITALQAWEAGHLDVIVVGAGGCNWASSPNYLRAIVDRFTPCEITLLPDAGWANPPKPIPGLPRKEQSDVATQIFKCLELFPAARVADWGQWRSAKADKLDPDEVPTDRLLAADRRIVTKDDLNPKRSKPVGFKPAPGAKAIAPKDGAIVLYHSSYAATGRGQWSWAWPRIAATITYQPGCLPSFELWQRMDRPKICYQPQDRDHLWPELRRKGYKRAIDTSEAGGGKTHSLGKYLMVIQDDLDRDRAIAQNENPDSDYRRSRAALVDPDHRNPSTDTTAALTPYPSKHGGLVITREGKVRVAGSNTPEDELFEPANCPSATIHQLLSQEGVNAPIGTENPVCAACPSFREHKGGWSCPVTEQVKQAQDGGAWIGHPAAVPVADGDVIAADESDRTIVTERTRNTDYPNQEWGRMQTIAPTLYEGLMADGVRSAQDRLTALAGKSKHGLDPLDTRATFLGALPVGTEGMFDPWGDRGAVARFNRVLGQSHMVYLGMFGAIEGNPTDLLLPSDPKNPAKLKAQVSPTRFLHCSRFPRNLAEFIGRLGGNPLDTLRELGDRAASPAMAKAAINDAKSVRAIGDLLQIAFSSPKSGTSIAADTYGLTITTRDRSMVKKLNRADFVLLADATGKLKETAHRFGWAADSIVEIQAIRSNYAGKLKIDSITGAGNFGAKRRDDSEFCAGQRDKILRQQVQALHPGEPVATFDKLAHLTGHGIEGAYFRDSRKSNDYRNCQALLMIGRPTPNLIAMASIYEVRTGEPVEDPLGRWDFEATNVRGHRRYCRWLRAQVIKEAVQTIARLRSQHGNSEKVVYLASDWPQWLIDGVLDYFPGAAFETQTIHQFCPEAAPKGSQTEKRVMETIAQEIVDGIKPTLAGVAAKLSIVKSTVSKAVKAVTGKTFRDAIGSFQMLFSSLSNKWKLEDLPPEAKALAETLKQLSIDLLDGTIAPDEARAQLAQSYIESGETVTAQAIEALPARERRALRAIVDRSSLVEWLEAQVAIYGRARVTGNRAIEHLDDRELARIAVDRHW